MKWKIIPSSNGHGSDIFDGIGNLVADMVDDGLAEIIVESVNSHEQQAEQIEQLETKYRKVYRGSAEEIERLKELQGIQWVDVKDRMPETDQEVLGLCGKSPSHIIFHVALSTDGTFCTMTDDRPIRTITHWAEINLPKAAQPQKGKL